MQHIFQKFRDLKILVIGDVMIDRYLTGNIHRISPEAPVPVVHLRNTENRLGGAANVALNIAALGATPRLISVIGEDEDADSFTDLLPYSNLSAAGIIRSAARRTTTKTRVLSAGQHVLRLDREDTTDLNGTETVAILSKIENILQAEKINVILLQDYNKGVLTQKVIRAVLNLAEKHRIPTAVDPKNKNFWAYRGVTLFKPNLAEIRANLPFSVTSDLNDLTRAGQEIRKRLDNRLSLITLSDAGLYLTDGGTHRIFPTQARTVRDVCGAGDTVISIAACCLGLDLPLENMAILSNLAGGQVCEKAGVVPVDKKQLEQEYQRFLQKY